MSNYFPKADKKYLTPNEKLHRFIGICIGINIGIIISIGVYLIAK
jgi:hypothetical protein